MANPSGGNDTAPPGTRPRKRSLKISGHATSISLEEAFWAALNVAAKQDDKSLAQFVTEIDTNRGSAGLSSAIRVHLLHRK